MPSFSNCPSDITSVTPANGDCTAVVSWTPPVASGTGTVTVVSNYNPGDRFFPGTHRVVYRATDNTGNTAFCTFNVEVIDNQNPTINVPADITTNVDPGSCGAVVTFPYPTASDNCPSGTGESPLEQDFTNSGGSPENFAAQCYELIGTQVGSSGQIDGSDELETLDLVSFDSREFTMPLTEFNGTGEIYFDHRIIAGGPIISLNARLTVSLVTTGGAVTQIFTENYTNQTVQTEYIPITQSGLFYVTFQFDTDVNGGDVAYLDNIYIPGFVRADEADSGRCGTFPLRVLQSGGQPYRSNVEFPVGTTTLSYLVQDASGNFGFNSFNVTVENNINPPTGSDVEYCEGETIPALSASVGSGETADWYDAPSGGNLLLADSATYTPSGPGTYYAETRNTTTGCISADRTPINLIENPRPNPPTSASPIEYCVGDTATQLTATGNPGNSIEWYDAATDGNLINPAPTPDTSTAGTTSYFVQQTDPGTGCSSLRTQVDVIVYALPSAPIVTSPLEYCIGDTADQLDDSATGTNLTWYDAPTGGNVIAGTFRPSTATAGTQNYWVTQTAGSGSINCESTRSQLVVNVNTPPTITANPSNQTICPSGNASFTATASDASTLQWQEFSGGSWNDLSDVAPYSNTTTTTLNITGATLAMNGNRYRLVASSAAATCGDVTSNEATLTVEDNTDPVLADCPTGPFTANSTAGSCGAPVTWTPPTATDDCGSVTITSNGYNPGDEFLPGTTTVIYTATDAAGNTDTCSFDIVVSDSIDPELTGPSNTTVQANNAGCTAIVNYADPVATDNCVMSTGEYPVFADFNQDRSVMASDCWGFAGTINSNSAPINGPRSLRTGVLAPTATNLLTSPLIHFNGTGQISFLYRVDNRTDNNPNLIITRIDEGGNRTEIYNRVYTTTTVVDNTIEVDFSGNYSLEFNFTSTGNVNNRARIDDLLIPGIKLSDPANGCARAEFNIVQTAGLASGSAFPIGTTTNTFEVTDAYGNTDTYSFDVTVENNLTVTANATDTEVCAGESVTLTGSGATSYTWDNGVTDGVALSPPTGTTTYTVTGTDANGCTDTDTITITVHPNPTVTANATATTINAGEPVTLTGSGANTYVWDNGVNDGDTVFPLTTTTYTVIGTDVNGCTDTDSITITVGATSDLRLEKTVDNASPNVGDTVTFQLTVTNDGPTDDVGGVVVNDILPSGFTFQSDNSGSGNGSYNTGTGDWTLPALTNGSSVSLEIDALVNVPAGTAEEYTNVAQVTLANNYDSDSTPNNDDGDQSEDDEAVAIVVPQTSDLEVLNTLSQPTANPGEVITVQVQITNTGTNNATNVALENNIPIGFTVQTIYNSGTQTGNIISWSGINVPAGASVTVSFEVIVNVPQNTAGEYLNTVQVTNADQYDIDSTPNNDDGDQSEDDEDNVELDLVPADLSITKGLSISSNQQPNNGDTITFEITITNDGPGIATNVNIEDVVPSGYTINTVNNGGLLSGNTISWTIANLPVGSEVLTYEATVNAPTNTIGEYTNTVQVSASDQFDPDSTPNNDDGDQSEDDEAMYSIEAPNVDLEVTKIVDRAQSFWGDTVVFTVSVTNVGAYEATNIGIEDVLPSGYELIEVNADTGNYDDVTSTWEIGVLAPQSSAALTMTVEVTDINDYLNVAELIYVDQLDLNTANDRGEASVSITQSECLTTYNEFSPNGDGLNEVFFIECIEEYPNNNLKVYNRWGNMVYEKDRYDNTWDGISMGRATMNANEKLPVGTYYYILELNDGRTPTKTGWIYISR